MAFQAELGALTDELVTIITNTSPRSQPKRFKRLRESAIRGIRSRDYLQTNQFTVEEQLRGLVETFSVIGRDGLSDALRQRLDALSSQSTRWTPEMLHLLLELSDQPAKKSDLRALERLRPSFEDPGPILRWEDIAKEDGWAQDRGLWKNVDFADSSDDELVADSQSQTSDSDTSMSSALATGQRTAKDLILPETEGDLPLNTIEELQKWRQDAQPRDESGRPMKIPVSEYQLLREVLFLLNGLPTTLFGPDCTPVSKFQLNNVSWDTYRALINSFAEYGRTVLPLRKFSETRQDVPLVQSFQDSVRQSLRALDTEIAKIQGRYVDIKQDTVVSLIALQEELKPHLVPLAGLSNVVRRLQEERFAHAFRFLELLYDETCISQLSGDERTYSYLGEIFFDCFRVYIRPIRQWMEDGELTPGDKTFFVAESSTSKPLHHMWSDKFQLRRSQQGQLHAPNFLQPAARKIFNTGKSVVVLKHLGRFQHPSHHPETSLPEPPLSFTEICASPNFALAPFSELFDSAFDRWVQSKHLSTSSNLQVILFDSCGLWSSLDALQHIYFMSDGSLASAFTSSIFSSLDSHSTTWTDRFSLTELAQAAFSPVPALEPYRLSATGPPIDDPGHARRSVRNAIASITLSYKLPWPVQLIITRASIAHYQALFTLLLQLRRAASTLTSFFKAGPRELETYDQQTYYVLRARLLWFTSTFHSYLTTLVLTPEITTMQDKLEAAEDVDDLIAIHTAFAKQITDEACLGAKLEPIMRCMLDVLDLAIQLEDARRAQEAGETSTTPTRFNTPRKPSQPAPPLPPSAMRGVYVSPKEKEREEDETIMLFGDSEQEDDARGPNGVGRVVAKQTYSEALGTVRADFERHLRFIAGGLRGVARASTEKAAAKWDVLAEMFEMGIREGR
ncbi:hypothetical protein N0V93_006206 [Gnomoniopsis smithogilvyi]|uniref:Spindle pole body component n=1 Tax=Gnomoniopsis smithogilvyi TaxID=1191159 RepID=A0A9W9CVD4_9PEZI|nr:hypothetical protein N0V93_006206 [Gnomoniopsis smithogilvyi]